VHQGLVSVAGAKKNYGVIVDPHTFAVGTSGKQEEKIDRGGTLSELLARCEEETGHKPPKPQWEGSVYGPHAGLEYVRRWFERMKREGKEEWDRA
jgi:5-oxoprolinase (ATP-hydrolysing)